MPLQRQTSGHVRVRQRTPSDNELQRLQYVYTCTEEDFPQSYHLLRYTRTMVVDYRKVFVVCQSQPSKSSLSPKVVYEIVALVSSRPASIARGSIFSTRAFYSVRKGNLFIYTPCLPKERSCHGIVSGRLDGGHLTVGPPQTGRLLMTLMLQGNETEYNTYVKQTSSGT